MFILVTTTAFQTAWAAAEAERNGVITQYSKSIAALMATNFDLRPQRPVVYVSPVSEKEGPPLLKYEGHRDDLIKIFVLAWAKFTFGTKGLRVTISEAQPTVHRIDFGIKKRVNVISLYDRLFDTDVTSPIRPNVFGQSGTKLHWYCEVSGETWSAQAIEDMFRQRLGDVFLFAKVRNGLLELTGEL